MTFTLLISLQIPESTKEKYIYTIITTSNQNNSSVSTPAKPGISKMVEITYQKTELIRNGFLFH